MIRKAVIPVAGRGTRLMPVTSVVPKALFPLVDNHNRIRSALHIICEQVLSAGVEQIGVVVSPWQIKMLQQYFEAVQENYEGGASVYLKYITQPEPAGFGDAVSRASDFVGDEPFMLLLGDHICIENKTKPPCTVQVAKAFDSVLAAAMIGMQQVSINELEKVGVATGVQLRRNIYRCTDFVEKPDLSTAQKRLATEGLPKDRFLAHCGIYIFTPEIFDCLSQVGAEAQKTGREIELADAQSLLLKKHPDRYFLYKIAGKAYDIGTPAGYAVAQKAFRGKFKQA